VLVEIRQLGGAFARGGEIPSAICHRDAAYSLFCVGVAAPPIAAATASHAAAVVDAMQPWSTGAALPNFRGGASAYDAETLDRLRRLVAAHDPDGLLLAADALR
jgi:hypothetical protein